MECPILVHAVVDEWKRKQILVNTDKADRLFRAESGRKDD